MSTTNKEYTEGIAKQAHLVKPGGTLLMLSLENYCSCNKGDMVETYTFDPYSRKFVGFLFSKFFSPPCTQISAATTPQSFKIYAVHVWNWPASTHVQDAFVYTLVNRPGDIENTSWCKLQVMT